MMTMFYQISRKRLRVQKESNGNYEVEKYQNEKFTRRAQKWI